MRCSVEGCDRPVSCRGWCDMHYKRWRRHGSPTTLLPKGRAKQPPERRVLSKFTVGDGCWLWTGAKSDTGYGWFFVGSRGIRGVGAHRFVYEMLVGPIPDGLSLDHLCRTPACVRPDHLDPVSHAENCLRGVSPPAKNAAKSHCEHGHPFDGENTYVRRDGGGRQCRTCSRQRLNQSIASGRKQAS